MHSGRAGRAGIFHPGSALETQVRRSLQDQRSGKILRREAGIEVAEHDFIDVGRRNPRVGKRLIGHPYNEAFDGLTVELSKGRMGPTDDTGAHVRSKLPFAEFWSFSLA